MLPILWWAFSWKLGVRLFVALVLSVYINTLIKDLVALPRPFVYADIANLRAPGEFSFPSGHAQQAAVFFGLLALHFKKRWFTIVAALTIFLIGFSRVYLGAHFPSDVLAGWTLGAAIAWGSARWSKTLAEESGRAELERPSALGALRSHSTRPLVPVEKHGDRHGRARWGPRRPRLRIPQRPLLRRCFRPGAAAHGSSSASWAFPSFTLRFRSSRRAKTPCTTTFICGCASPPSASG